MVKLNSNQDTYTNCIVEDVTKGQEKKFIHCIHLSSPTVDETIIIGIQNSFENIMFQLQELREGRRNRCHFAKGLINVDIVRDEKEQTLSIIQSEQDNSYSSYQLESISEIETLMNRIQTL